MLSINQGEAQTYSELEGLDQTNGLIHGTTNREIVHGDLAENTLGIDNEEATKSDALILNEDVVIPGNLVCRVCKQGKLEIRT